MWRTYLAFFDAYIGNGQRRPSPEVDASVAIVVDSGAQGDLDILKVCSLGHAPPERCEGVSCTRLVRELVHK